MALAALIAAYHESAEPGVLRATLLLAGRTVLERQARLAAAAGASRIIVLVERTPAELSAAIDRLRRQRLPVQVARSPEEAAEAVDPADRLLLIADGAVADSSQLARLAPANGLGVLTVPDASFGEIYERIDATSRWAGLAAVTGAVLRETATMLRDWDMQSTLLRRALQSGAQHYPADAPVAILDSHADLAGLERQILASAAETKGDWASRLLAPFERAVTSLLMNGPLGPASVGTAAAALTAGGMATLGSGWLWTGLILMLLATPLEGVARRLARLRMLDDVGRSWWSALLPLLAGGGLIALGYTLGTAAGWGMVLLAFTTLTFMIAFAVEAEGRMLPGAAWLAERRGMTWLVLPFALLDAWEGGLVALFAYSAGSFFWAQRQAHAPAASR